MKKKHSRALIKDEFTDLPMSRQQKYQLRRQKEGKCIICGQPRASTAYCLKHLIASRENARRRIGAIRRNHSFSYRLQETAKVPRRARARSGAKPPRR